jgi:hypothetical protein
LGGSVNGACGVIVQAVSSIQVVHSRWSGFKVEGRLVGSLTTLGYSASRMTTIDVTDLIVPQATIRNLNMFLKPKAVVTEAWNVIVSLLKSGATKPIRGYDLPSGPSG